MPGERSTWREFWTRADRAFGPVLAGVLLDAVDLATFGPIGLALGFPLGALAGWYLMHSFRVPPKWRWLGALLSGVYCTMPFTEFIPAATLAGVLVRWMEPAPRNMAVDKVAADAPTKDGDR